jgi:hypothetical protein
LSSALVTATQAPVAHVRHAPVHADGQHAPSLQKPLAQSAGAVQVWPAFFLQVPEPSQVEVPVHSGVSSALATVEQVPVAQLWHGPPQPVSQQAPSLQYPLAHSVASVQAWPFFFLQTPAASQL